MLKSPYFQTIAVAIIFYILLFAFGHIMNFYEYIIGRSTIIGTIFNKSVSTIGKISAGFALIMLIYLTIDIIDFLCRSLIGKTYL